MCPYAHLFGVPLTTYSILNVLALIAAGLLLAALAPRFGIGRQDAFYMLLLCSLCGLVGAKLLYILTALPFYLAVARQYPSALLPALLRGGGVYWGGFLGGALMALSYLRLFRLPVRLGLSLMAAPLALAHGIGRLACFSVGCCYGVPVSWGVPFAQSPIAPNGRPLLPVQLIEAGFNFILALALILLGKRPEWRPRLLTIYLVAYPVFRFAIEFFRGDAYRGFWLGLSTSQWIALLLLVLNGTDVCLRRWRRKAASPRPSALPPMVK